MLPGQGQRAGIAQKLLDSHAVSVVLKCTLYLPGQPVRVMLSLSLKIHPIPTWPKSFMSRCVCLEIQPTYAYLDQLVQVLLSLSLRIHRIPTCTNTVMEMPSR